MDNELKRLHDKLEADGITKSCVGAYEILKTDYERFSYTLNIFKKYKLKPEVKIKCKSSIESERYRTAGNKLFLSKRSNEERDTILEFYNKSIIFAELKSQQLAYGYGNRSALLYNVSLYDHCIRDIDRALIIDCTESLKIKLLSRRIYCLMAIDQIQQTENEKIIAEKINEYIEKLRIDDTLKTKMKEYMEKSKSKIFFTPQRKLFDEEKLKPQIPNDNSELPGVSEALKVSYDEKFGRHVRSTRKIYPGEVLAVQKGYATILSPENFHTHCSNCLRQTWSAVACKKCVQAIYCDESCRDAAFIDHHDVECGVIDAMIHQDFNLLGLMSLRLAIRAVRDAGGFEALKNKIEDLESCPDRRTKGFTGSPPILVESDYSSVYTLAKNTEKRSSPDLFGRSFNSVYVVYYVATISNFLGEKMSPDLDVLQKNPWAVLLGGLITTHQQIIPSNVHTVTETKGISDRERGASLIPFLSLFNHSCDSSVTRVHYGRHVVLYAIQKIEANEQVYDNYGMHYAIEPRFNRQLRLQRQFYFTCRCRPCNENWPMFQEISSWTKQELDNNIKKKLKNSLKNFPRYVEIATNQEIVDRMYIVKDVAVMLTTLYTHVRLPCREINEVAETLKRLYTLLSTRYQSLSETPNHLSI